ncbi:MAG: Gfo/Idh/MocA family oxidoreductase, partial [Coxiellaceae bacterium]|nr:Gfo/Idh/MocA family oxidoreductase [Coxiellaceae bacterium]
MSSIKCAVIGVGYLGKFHAEKYAALPQAELVGICDIDQGRVDEIAQQLGVPAYTDYHELLGKVDAVSIAVPTAWHYPIAKTFLTHNTHVLLEKPITPSLQDADDLVTISENCRQILQIGHLERFNPVLGAVVPMLQKPQWIEAVRTAPYKPRGTDISVILDLMIHDIEIIQRLVAAEITNIQATGAVMVSDKIDVANARLQFANGCVANLTASRVSFNAERQLRILQQDAFFSLDMQHKKLGIQRKGMIQSEERNYEQNDALLAQITAFLHSVATGDKP